MSFKFLAMLLMLLLLIVSSQAQRGGGRGRSSGSRSSSRSSSWGRSRSRSSGRGWFWSSSNSSNSTNSTGDFSSGEGSWAWLPIIGGIGGFAGFAGYKNSQKKKAERLQKINELFSKYEGDCESQGCSLNEAQMNELRDWFMSQKWYIKFETKDRTFTDRTDITIKNLDKKSSLSYTFQMEMSDSVGPSKITGILVHKADHFGIMFEKTYNNRDNAGQTGQYDLLLYEGNQQGQEFRGNWAYKGFEYSSSFSGKWQLIHF